MKRLDNVLSPDMFLIKTCMVGSGSAEVEREETEESDESDETLLERILAAGVALVVCGSVIASRLVNPSQRGRADKRSREVGRVATRRERGVP